MILFFRSRLLACSALATVLFAGTGCYKATFYSDPQAVRGAEHDEWTDFFLFGLVGKEDVDVQRFCASERLAAVRTGANVGTGVISVITIGIYTPRKVYVTCAAPKGTPAADSNRPKISSFLGSNPELAQTTERRVRP